MSNYHFIHFVEKNNKDIQGYKLVRGNEELEILLYDIDKISYKDLKQRKREFFNFICSKYADIDRRSLLFNHSTPAVTLRYIGISQEIIDESLLAVNL